MPNLLLKSDIRPYTNRNVLIIKKHANLHQLPNKNVFKLKFQKNKIKNKKVNK